MKIKYNRTKEQLTDSQKQRDKATTVFTKLYAKRRGKYKGWNSLDAKTMQTDDKSEIRNELEVIE